MEKYVLDPDKIRDLAPDVLGADGRLKVLPASFWAETTPDERAMFGVRHGLYGFPTLELVEYLGNLINGRSAIEIGAGSGVLCEALGIKGTDSYQQREPKYRAFYELHSQPIVEYGPNVEKIDARTAVKAFKPQVVIGSWVTHKYDPRRAFAGGNEAGVDEVPIIRRVETYVLIGNQKVHSNTPIWNLPHSIVYPDWVYSRAWNGTPDFVATWGS